MSDQKYLSDLASSLQGHAQCMSYSDKGDLKRVIREASNALDSSNIYVHVKRDGLLMVNARGKARFMTIRERIAYYLLGKNTDIRP